MPPSTAILDGLAQIANSWIEVAVAWHVAIAGLAAAVIAGWRPTQRQWGLLLTLPLLSVAVFGWLTQNLFNGTLFTAAAVVLGAAGARLPNTPAPLAASPVALLGIAMVAFGWVYPHFLERGSIARYLYAAPVGLLPCPTLSVGVGFALLADGLGSRTWSIGLAAVGLFYGLFGTFRLGVPLDSGLIIGAAALAALGLRTGTSRAGPARPVEVARS